MPAGAIADEALAAARIVFIRKDRHRRWVNGNKGVVTRMTPW